ncbi:MAG: hypothetical protein OK454_06045 [Thaumarchaeota archaeon]|nr:hypothetical protein [Nitrososphaerota archaeon]
MKKTAAGVLSGKDIEKAYSIYEGLFFEGSWVDDKALAAAFIAWAKKAWPARASKYGKVAAALETALRDEEGEGVLADFVNSLPPELRARAAQGIHDDVSSMDDTPKALLGKLAALASAGPAERVEDPGELMEEANDLYQDEEFKKALALVGRVLEGVGVSPSGTPKYQEAIGAAYLLKGWLYWNAQAGMVDLDQAVTCLTLAIRWGEAVGKADDAFVSLCQIYCGELRNYPQAIALAQQALASKLSDPKENRFYLLKTLGFAQLANGDRDAARRTYKTAFDEYRKDDAGMESLEEELRDEYPKQGRDNQASAIALAEAFRTKTWIA